MIFNLQVSESVQSLLLSSNSSKDDGMGLPFAGILSESESEIGARHFSHIDGEQACAHFLQTTW